MELELMKEQLKSEYREVFEAVWVYGNMKNVSAEMLTDRLTELYDILLTAQTEGRDVKRIVGSNTERFCKDIYGDYTVADKLRQLPDRIYGFAWVIFVLELLTLIAESGSGEKTVCNILPYLFGIGIGVIFELICRFVILPIMFKNKRISPNAWSNAAVISFIVIFIGILIFEENISTELNVPTLPLVIGSGAYIASFFAARSIWRYRHFGTIRNERKLLLKDSHYKELSTAQLEGIVLKGWKKQYEKQSAKGKVKAEGYLEKLKKSEHINDIVDRGFDIFIAAIYIAAVIGTAADNEEGITDVLLFALICGVITFGIWRFFSKAFKQGTGVRKKLIQECEQAGMKMPEYIESRLAADNEQYDLTDEGAI